MLHLHTVLRATIGFATALALAVTLLSACGDDDGTEARFPACDELSSVESYRYNLTLGLDIPAFGEDVDEPLLSDPLNAFSDALSALFSDMQIDGAHVAPDRTQVTLTFEGEELEWRSIGDQSWVRHDDEWEEQESSPTDDILTPDVVCDDIVDDLSVSFSALDSEEEIVNGVDTYHYTLGKDDIEELPDILGGSSAGDVPDDMQFEIWLAQDGLWPMKVEVHASDTDDSGLPVALNLSMELSDINDSNVSIDPPEGFE